MILQTWGLNSGVYPVKFRIKALSPADDDLRLKVDGVIVSNTLLNVAFYTGSIILDSASQNLLWQSQGFREIEISASQAIAAGSPWKFGSTVDVDVANTGAPGMTTGQWRNPIWTASVHFSDGRIAYKTGGRNDPGDVETSSVENPGYHENGNFKLDFSVPVVYSELVKYSFNDLTLNPSFIATDFSASTLTTGSASVITAFFTGSAVNIGGSQATSPIFNIRGFDAVERPNNYVGFNLTNNSGRTYNIKTFEFDLGMAGSTSVFKIVYSFDNFVTTSSAWQMTPLSITQYMNFVAPITGSLPHTRTLGVRIMLKSQSGNTAVGRFDNLRVTGE